jgi:hypothetical protein
MKHPFKSREPTIGINRDFRARRQFVATNCFLLLETRRNRRCNHSVLDTIFQPLKYQL